MYNFFLNICLAEADGDFKYASVSGCSSQAQSANSIPDSNLENTASVGLEALKKHLLYRTYIEKVLKSKGLRQMLQ